jgi:hypothetical protein
MKQDNYITKKNLIQSGCDVIVSYEEISLLESEVDNIRSLHNPKQVGILDGWLAWVKEGYAGGNALILAANQKSDEFCSSK